MNFQGIVFCYPIILAAPIVLFIAALFVRQKKNAALFPNIDLLRKTGTSWRIKLRAIILPLLAAGFIIFLSLAAARPQRITIIQQPYESRNLFLTLDISPSMGAEDFKAGSGVLPRLVAVKKVVAEFIKARPYDRIGLVVFGGKAYLQSPLTLDHQVILQLVDRLDVGMAGDGTALGDGMGLSLKRMEDIEKGAKAIILLTDGVSNAGQVNPLKAAKVAKDLGVKIHTIGIGTDQPVSRQFPASIFGQAMPTQSEYDEKTLKQIAEITGGTFFNASDIKGLKEVYAQIDKLEKTAREEPEKRIPEELFYKYALIALLCFLGYTILTNTVFLKVP